MRRLLRLLTLLLFALALPIQGVTATTAMLTHAHGAPHAMTMPGGTTTDAAALPCHGRAVDKAGCGACCAPIVADQATLIVAPVAPRWTALPPATPAVAEPLFLTGGTDRPPRLPA
jgi:hypothetical protein